MKSIIIKLILNYIPRTILTTIGLFVKPCARLYLKGDKYKDMDWITDG